MCIFRRGSLRSHNSKRSCCITELRSREEWNFLIDPMNKYPEEESKDMTSLNIGVRASLQPWKFVGACRARICKESRNRLPGVDSASLCSLAVLYDNPICRTGSTGYISWWHRFLRIDSWAP